MSALDDILKIPYKNATSIQKLILIAFERDDSPAYDAAEQLSTLHARIEGYEEALWKIRNSAGQVMITTAEGHSECVHIANEVLHRDSK